MHLIHYIHGKQLFSLKVRQVEISYFAIAVELEYLRHEVILKWRLSIVAQIKRHKQLNVELAISSWGGI